MVERKEVASFFEPSVKCVVDSVSNLVEKAHNPISVSGRRSGGAND